jgi:hypothetical protein
MTDPLNRFLAGGDTLARLHDHARRLQRLQARLEQALPGAMSEACTVANVKDDTLILIARSGSVAARVRQMAPSLIGAFAGEGAVVRRIEVKVGVRLDEALPPPREARILGDKGRESIEALITDLPADDPLRASLQTLLDRSRRA